MVTVRKTITLTHQQDEWIKAQINVGKFTNDSEYIRALVRRDQERKYAMQEVSALLIEGEESGISTLTPEQIREDVQMKMRENDRL